MKKSARTQNMSADIMAYLGNISRENYTNDIRFKLGGSGGTDHQSHRKLRTHIMRYMTVMHRQIECISSQDNSQTKQFPLINLDGLMKAAMQNKAFDGDNDSEFVSINDEQVAAYIEVIEKNPCLHNVIEAAMAFKAAHIRVFVCHQYVCKKLVSDEIPSLLGNKVDDLRNRISPVVSAFEAAREAANRSGELVSSAADIGV